MADLEPGKRVRARRDHSGVHAGSEGTIVSRTQGTVYAVNYPGFGLAFSPGDHLNPVDQDPDHDHDPDPGPDVDDAAPAGSPAGPGIAVPSPTAGSRGWTVASWEQAMQRFGSS